MFCPPTQLLLIIPHPSWYPLLGSRHSESQIIIKSQAMVGIIYPESWFAVVITTTIPHPGAAAAQIHKLPATTLTVLSSPPACNIDIRSSDGCVPTKLSKYNVDSELSTPLFAGWPAADDTGPPRAAGRKGYRFGRSVGSAWMMMADGCEAWFWWMDESELSNS